MKYFIISQDERIENTPSIKDTTKNPIEKMKLDDKANILYVQNTDAEVEYIDYIDKPLLLLSDKMKNIIKAYNKSFEFRVVTVTDLVRETQEIYWNVELPIVECVGNGTEYSKNDLIKTLVVNESKVTDLSFFQIKNKIQTINVIRLDLAESILRRDLYGFRLIEIESEVD